MYEFIFVREQKKYSITTGKTIENIQLLRRRKQIIIRVF